MKAPGYASQLLAGWFAQHQSLRFVVVGIVNTVFGYGMYALFLFVGLPVAFASLFSLLIGIAFSFATQGAMVFGNSSDGAFIRFVAIWLVIYGAYLATVFIAQHFGLNSYLGGIVATPVVALMSYYLQRQFVFRNTSRLK